jgi:HEAT repeat protein
MMRTDRFLWAFGVVLVLTSGPSLALAQQFLGKPVGQWVRELSAESPQTRRGAAFALGKIGAAAAPQLPRLASALKDPDGAVREAAVSAIGEIGQSLVNPYLQTAKENALRSGDRRYRAEERLGDEVARAWDQVGGELVHLLNEADPALRQSAAYAVGGFGPGAASAREALEKAFRDADAGVRQNAAWSVGRLGKAAGSEGVRGLSKALGDGDPAVRRNAADALGQIGRPTASSALGALAECCRRDGDAGVRQAAVDALINLASPEDRAATNDLRGLLGHADPVVTRGAALALANIGGREAMPAVPVLRQVLQDEDPAARSLAAAALASIGEFAGQAVPELSAALGDPDEPVRRNVALALGRIGPAARTAIPALARALRSEEPSAEVRRFAAEALARVGQTDDPGQFREIERLLIDQALPHLLRALQKDPDSSVRQRTVWALFLVQEPERVGVAEALTNVLRETSSESALVRYDAARCLATRMGSRAPDKAVDVLLEMLNDRQIRIYHRTDAQVSGGGEGQTGGSRLAANLGGDARYLAAQALAHIGAPKANRPAILDALRDAQKSTDPLCREEAGKALAVIQGR